MAVEDVKIFHKHNTTQSFISLVNGEWTVCYGCARVGPCGSEGKGDISLWLGGKGVYIHTASMTHISCLPEHSLFRSHTRRKPLIETNPTTMTCVMLEPTQITATEGFFFSFVFYDSVNLISQQNRPVPCCVGMFWPLHYTETQSLVRIKSLCYDIKHSH